MSRNATTHVDYEELDIEIQNLINLKSTANTEIDNKYNELKNVFVCSDSLAAEQFYTAADSLYSINKILDDMLNQTIYTLNYAKVIFQDSDSSMSNVLEEDD